MREKRTYKCAASKQKEKVTGGLYRTSLVCMGRPWVDCRAAKSVWHCDMGETIFRAYGIPAASQTKQCPETPRTPTSFDEST